MRDHLQPRELIDFDRLESARREAALAHLEACADCRGRWLAEDPTRIFALLSLSPIPEAALDDLSARLGDAIDSAPDSSRRRSRVQAFTAVAASLLLAAVFLGYLSTRSTPLIGTSPTLAPTAVVERIEQGEGRPTEGVEVISSPGAAQVLELSVGETQVVMIFDEAMEI